MQESATTNRWKHMASLPQLCGYNFNPGLPASVLGQQNESTKCYMCASVIYWKCWLDGFSGSWRVPSFICLVSLLHLLPLIWCLASGHIHSLFTPSESRNDGSTAGWCSTATEAGASSRIDRRPAARGVFVHWYGKQTSQPTSQEASVQPSSRPSRNVSLRQKHSPGHFALV